MNIHYPRTETNGMYPWYMIAFRLPCYVIYKVLLSFTAISIIPIEGISGALEFWEKN